ncbi:MAG: polysaccharide pyruvyl transferase CsaB [Cyanobacteria bacterium J06631_9]
MRAVLCGYYGMGNGGDEALLASLLQMLPEHVSPVVLSGNPAETRDRHQVQDVVPRKSFGAVVSAFRRSDAFIWGGGSLMQDASSALNPAYYGGLMLMAQLMGLKTIAWAQGIGPLNKKTSQWLTRAALSRCDGVSVRDRTSAALLTQWNRKHLLAPDPVWAMDSESVAGFDCPSPRVAVALRPHPQLTESRLTIIASALSEFQQLTSTSLLLVPFQPVKDLAIAQFLSSQLNGPHQIYSLAQPQQLKGLFREVEMTIGMRFHALIMSAAEGRRSFAISYDPKVDAIAQALSLPGYDLAPSPAVLPPLPDDAHRLCQVWLDCYQQERSVSTGQLQSVISNATKHQTLLNEVLFSNST